MGLATLGREFEIDVMPRDSAPEIDISGIVVAATTERYFRGANVKCFGRFFLDPIMRQACVIFNEYLDRTVSKTLAAAFVGFDNCCFAAGLSNDDNVGKYSRSNFSRDVYLDWLSDAGLFRNPIRERLGKCYVQRRE